MNQVRRRGVVDALHRSGDLTPAPLTPPRRSALEQRVMRHVGDSARWDGADTEFGAQTDCAPRRRSRSPVSAWGLRAAIVLGIVGVATAFAVVGSHDDSRTVLAAADEVIVERPDGTVMAGAAGVELADGSLVTVGPSGRAGVGDVVYGTGRYRVDDGALTPIAGAAPRSSPIPTTLPETAIPTTAVSTSGAPTSTPSSTAGSTPPSGPSSTAGSTPDSVATDAPTGGSGDRERGSDEDRRDDDERREKPASSSPDATDESDRGSPTGGSDGGAGDGGGGSDSDDRDRRDRSHGGSDDQRNRGGHDGDGSDRGGDRDESSGGGRDRP